MYRKGLENTPEMIDIQPIHDIPALKIGNTVVIGDLHIGVESHLMKKGFHLQSRTWDMFNTIASIEKVSRLVVLGDVKDSVPGSSKQEYREIPEFFERLLERFDIVDVVRGNHDTNIEEFLPSRVRVGPASGIVIDNVGLVHGHTWPSRLVMKTDVLVTAHNHPTVMFCDGIGRTATEPCWVRGKFTGPSDKYEQVPGTFIIVPAFNRMLGGSPVNVEGQELLGPLMNSELVDMKNARLHSLDGIDLGTVSGLLVKNKRRSFGKKHTDTYPNI